MINLCILLGEAIIFNGTSKFWFANNSINFSSFKNNFF